MVASMDLKTQLIGKGVSESWFFSDEGLGFLKRQELQTEWIAFLSRFGFDAWFTVTYKTPAASSILAIDRTQRVLRKAFKQIKTPLDAFIVSEQHRDGTYHSHGMLKLGALSAEMERQLLRYLWDCTFHDSVCGRNSFSIIRESDAVRRYVSKYLVKRPADFRFLGFKGFGSEAKK